MRRECQERFPANTGQVSFEIGDGENIPGIPGACASRSFKYLIRGPCAWFALGFCFVIIWCCNKGRYNGTICIKSADLCLKATCKWTSPRPSKTLYNIYVEMFMFVDAHFQFVKYLIPCAKIYVVLYKKSESLNCLVVLFFPGHCQAEGS